jgi:hypothetical protein
MVMGQSNPRNFFVGRGALQRNRAATVVSVLLLMVASAYLLLAQIDHSGSIRFAMWMALLPFGGAFPLFVYSSYLGLAIAKANNPNRYEGKKLKPSDVPMRYRFAVPNQTFDRRDIHIKTYLPTWKRFVVLGALFGVISIAEFISATVTNVGIPKFRQHFFTSAPAFASFACIFLVHSLSIVRVGRSWLMNHE